MKLKYYFINLNFRLRNPKLNFPFFFLLGTLLVPVLPIKSETYSIKDLSTLLTTNSCFECNLKGVDLINQDLRSAEIINSNLKGANLSGSMLDNVDFSGTNLNEASLNNTSIVKGRFKNSKLNKTDFRYSDLRNTEFDFEGLKNSIWTYAIGLGFNDDNYINFYNQAVRHFNNKEYGYALNTFTLSIYKDPLSVDSHLSRAILYFYLGNINESEKDLIYTEKLIKRNNTNIYDEIIINLKEEIENRKKFKRNYGDAFIRTLIQGYSLFKFI